MTPSLRFVALLFAASLGPVAVTVMGIPLIVGMLPTAMLLTVAIADRLTGTRTPVEITRKVRSVLSVGTENSAELWERFGAELAQYGDAGSSVWLILNGVNRLTKPGLA